MLFGVYKTVLLTGLITYSSVMSNGSAMMMIAQSQYILYNLLFVYVVQIFFTVFYKDIPHHFTHRLSCEYKENISSSMLPKKQLVCF